MGEDGEACGWADAEASISVFGGDGDTGEASVSVGLMATREWPGAGRLSAPGAEFTLMQCRGSTKD